jgi:hypothetical protein
MVLHKNLSDGSRDFVCGRTDGRIDITGLIVTFRNCSTSWPKRAAFFLREVYTRIYVICVIRTNIGYFPKQRKPICLYNGDEECLLSATKRH